MSLFANDGKGVPDNNPTYNIKIRHYWFFWYWSVEYVPNYLYNRSGFTLNREKALRKTINVVKHIARHTGEDLEDGF